ncbi:MAG: PKD domain-containing protein [Deltaproteobacteria bacterium]|nr:PKD domain-containing protein [Deltaproteobacteria bacterium]
MCSQERLVYIDGDFQAEIAAWEWDFGDGMTSAERNPTHTYTDSGAYTVSLTVMDSSGATTTTAKESFVVVGPSSVLKAEFTAKTRSYEPNPMHIYTEPGAYTVTLTVTGPEGSDSDSKADFVHNIVGTVYVDNSFHWKPHYYSGSMIKFGKTILYTGSIKIPHEELGYSRIFYGGCNSSNYYVGTFNKGIMFFTVANMEDILADVYLEHYLLGDTDDEILAALNDIEPIFEYYNFNLKPPSIDK